MTAALREMLVLPPGRADRGLLIATGLLLAFGLVMVASASVAVADRYTDTALYYFYRQAAYAVVGLAAGAVVLYIPTRLWRANSFALLALALVMLVVVLIPGIGESVNGARRWIDLGLVSVQVSVPARLFLLLYLAGYALRRSADLRSSFIGLIRPALPIGLACLLMLLQPDYGSCVIMFVVTGTMLFLAGARLSHVVVLALGAAVVFALVAFSSPYRMERLTSFADPWADPFTTGFQLTQSLIAFGRGQIFGVGLGNSVQKLLYLPETHTDFLFAILAEEFGLVGSLVVIALFTVLIWRGFGIAARAMAADQPFGAYVAYGIVTWIGLQSFVNIGVNMGLLPTKGLPLPLRSYGGSSLGITCVQIALLLRVDL
ncbi:MAG: putative lipid II flippase FtsW, partial [Salinisphaera sp.]|nr:putative lipid II flippase FtsW [Salinisphaera sp.]